jgi:CRP-like cAMP-binding protein
VFRPVTIGGPLRIHGATFRFFYALHSIPTVGFECFYGGQSFVYSSDTLYDPPRIEELFAEGVIGRERRDALLSFPWQHSLVVHEAGVPPIHTPAARLAELAPDIKQRLRIIHIAERDLPPGAGLRLARVGFDETVTLAVEPHPHAAALEALDALAAVDLLSDFTVERCRDFLTVARRERHRAGSLIIGQGEPGEAFYIILHGEAAVVKDGAIIRSYRDGDFFGETALLTAAPRSADVRAKTDVDLVAVDKYDFLALLAGTDLAAALVRLAQNRDLPSWNLMSENAVLRHLRAQQRTAFQAALEHHVLAAGQVLWSAGDVADAAWLLDDATVDLGAGGRSWLLGRAAFLCELEALLRGRPQTTRAVVRRGGGAFRVAARHLAELLERSPALLLALGGATFVE